MRSRSATRSGAVWRLGLILLLSAALWPLSLRAEAPIGRFVIGVWSPAGWSGGNNDSYDRFFTSSDADSLAELGVNLLVQTPRIGERDIMAYQPREAAHEILQKLEKGIIEKFKTHGGLVVEQAAEEDLPRENPRPGNTTYTSRVATGDRLIDFAGVSSTINSHRMEQQAIALSDKWGGTDYVDGFFGYFIGHERYPYSYRESSFQGGIYDSATYTNLGKVIDAIRRHDTTRAIVAVGNTRDTGKWSAAEQTAFRKEFFRSDMAPPANVFMNEQYILWCDTTTEPGIQARLDALVGANGSLDRTRDMVVAARNDGRKAEWYHIINVNNEYRVGEFRDIDDDGDLEWIDNPCWRSGSVANSPHLRRPSKAELSVQAYMALARGATGIVYYSHTTNGLAALTGYDDPTDPDDNTPPATTSCVDELSDHDQLSEMMSTCVSDLNANWAAAREDTNLGQNWYFGLMRFSPNYERNRRKSVMFSTVQAVNTRLKVIGNALYPVKHKPLTWDANYDNFTSTNGLSATTLVDAVWPNGRPSSTAAGRLEFGQFHNGEADYVLAVNRLTKTGQTVDLRFDVAQMASVDVGGGSFQVEDVSVGDGTPSTLIADANGHITVTGQTLDPGEARLYRIEWLPTVQAQWVVDGAHVFAHEKARLTWDDPGNTAITGWEYQQQEGDSAWGPWQEASSSATTVTKDVEGLRIWGTYRFMVRARYGPGADDTGPESAEAVLSPGLDLTQVPTVVLLGGDGQAQLEVGIEWPVDLPDLPEGSLRILPGNLQVQVVTVPATGEKTESEFVALSSIEEVLPGAALAEAPLEDLPPGEEPASGEAGATASSASSRAVSSFGVSGLKNGVTYQFKVRLVRPDGVTGPASATGSLLGLRQRRTGDVALSWTGPGSPAITAITAWQYRQQAGSESWGSWRRMSGSTRSTTSHTVSGLGAAETYRFQVRGIGPGGPFAESFTVSAPAVPSAPRNFTAVAGDGQVLVTWQAPASTGGSPLLGYHYREIVAGDTTAWFEFLRGWTRYLPQELSNGVAHTFEVRAYNREGSSASVDTTVTPAGAPRAPGGFTAAPGAGQVALSWTAADSNGAPITAYEVQYAPKSDSGAEVDWSNVTWSEVPGDSTARDTTITGLSHGTPYGFRVAARNRVNLGTPAEKEATPQGNRGNRPPVITAPDTVWFAEHRTDSVATLSASDPEGQAVTWSHTGADVGWFKVRGDTLSFKVTPDFEAPADADEDNFYEVTLTATDDGEPAASASHDMTVAVTNAPEAGTVTLSTTQPRVGMHLTATLIDPDQGVANDHWSWEELDGASSAGQRTRAPAQSQRYTVEDRVKGRRLLAKVTYTDGHGPDQAVSDTTAAVRANVPGAPGSLEATAGDGRVTLRWTSADSNGAWITGYAYRDSAHTAGSTWSAWPETAPIAGDATSHPVTGLDNGTGYTFEVRAVNPVGAGPARARPRPRRGGRTRRARSTCPIRRRPKSTSR